MPRYNQYDRHRMSLNTVDFQPTVFTPIEFRPVEQDYSILERAMAKQEERKEKAITQQSLVKQALGKAREQLHQDDDTLRWFDTKARDIEDRIQLSADLGDYASALETGITAAGDIANDKELTARIRTNAQYNEEFERQRDRIGKGISKATFDWWVKNNPYNYSNITDNTGRIIGGNDWKSNFTPVDDLNVDKLAFTAFKLLSPEQYHSSSGSNVEPGTKNKYSNIARTGTNNYERITVDRIYNNINEIIGSNPDNWIAVRQGFQVALNELNKLKEERDKYPVGSDEYKLANKQYEDQLAYFKGENNQDLSNNEESWKLYTARVITDNAFAKGMAYDWKTVASTVTVGKPDEPTYPTIDSPITGGYNERGGDDHTESSSGNMVNKKRTTSDAYSRANVAGQQAGDQFGNVEINNSSSKNTNPSPTDWKSKTKNITFIEF